MASYLSGAQALVKALEREKVEVIFGIPGGATLTFYDALKDSSIRHVLARHEQSAAHMADGYARASGKVGVCTSTSGPGATNLLTGIATAYLDSSPVIAITGQVARDYIGKDAFQEIDTVGIFTPVVKYAFQPLSVSEIPFDVKAAFYIATTGRQGPVLIDLPKDVQAEKAEIEFPERVEIKGYRPYVRPDPEVIREAAKLIIQSQKPVILVGGGAVKSEVGPKVVELAEMLMIPIASTLMGKGAIPENHFLAVGPIGMHGTYHANTLIMESDLVIGIGVRFSDRTTMDTKEFSKDRMILHFDIDPTEARKNIVNEFPVIGDLNESISMLVSEIRKMMPYTKDSPWYKRVKELKEYYEDKIFGENVLSPFIIKKIREILHEDDIVTTEVGQAQAWAELFYKALRPRTFITSGGLGTMGFGFPAAIGAKVAKFDKTVVDIAGDGSFLMTSNSLATSVKEGIPVVVVILDNAVLGMIAQWQRLVYNNRYIASSLGETPNFPALAKAYGAEGVRVNGLEDFEKYFKEAVKSDVTYVIDVPISPEENVFPFVPAGKSLKEMIV
ncbi:MAG: biosynthetic-type acetolactate synthase large subunit [Nitrososphaeria archaeon]|nr:biosynthetic-type acetolactate synthase large subunit [Conexivisphaerales archaeon]